MGHDVEFAESFDFPLEFDSAALLDGPDSFFRPVEQIDGESHERQMPGHGQASMSRPQHAENGDFLSMTDVSFVMEISLLRCL